MTAATAIAQYNPCDDALCWLGKRPPKRAWDECPRGDWMLWIAARIGVDRKLIVRAACDCARTALKYVPRGEDRPRIAIETAERWCDGTATIAEVRAAAYDAADAAAAAAADRSRALKRCAALVRERIPWAVVRARLNGGK